MTSRGKMRLLLVLLLAAGATGIASGALSAPQSPQLSTLWRSAVEVLVPPRVARHGAPQPVQTAGAAEQAQPLQAIAPPAPAASGMTAVPSNGMVLPPGVMLALPPEAMTAKTMRAVPPTVRSRIQIAPTETIPAPEPVYPFLEPAPPSQNPAVLARSLSCVVEVTENDHVLAHQTMGCGEAGSEGRAAMLAQLAHEVPDRNPNMHYSLAVQLERFQAGDPVVRTRMRIGGLIGRSRGQREYESVVVASPRNTHTLVAFSVDQDHYAVTLRVLPRR